jgi:hypothetical protein
MLKIFVPALIKSIECNMKSKFILRLEDNGSLVDHWKFNSYTSARTFSLQNLRNIFQRRRNEATIPKGH